MLQRLNGLKAKPPNPGINPLPFMTRTIASLVINSLVRIISASGIVYGVADPGKTFDAPLFIQLIKKQTERGEKLFL